MESVSNILFSLSSGLLFPVMILLIALFAYALVICVVSFVDFNKWTAERRIVKPIVDSITADNLKDKLGELTKMPPSCYIDAVKQIAVNADSSPARARVLSNIEVDMDKRLSRFRMLVKLGPMLGLMGTLIPMGPALTGLASGDVASMAYNMEVAFATTVLGILIAAIGVVTLQRGKRCCARMINDLDFINEMLDEDEKA